MPEVKARMKLAAKIHTMAVGIEGAPYVASRGSIVKFPSMEAFEKAAAMHPEGTFELIESPKAAKKPAKKGGGK